MRTVRTRLAALTLLLLLQQAVGLAVAGALACCDTNDVQPAARTECCEDAADGHMCPLGHRPPPDRQCRMKSGCSTEGPGVLAGAGFTYAAPLVGRFTMLPPVTQPLASRMSVPDERLAKAPPPSPPPKA
jgi:hypothetical protein